MVATMEALCFVAPHQVEWREVPAPVLASGLGALVRPIAVATCDLDARIVHGEAPLPGPFILGHEVIADVVAVGASVRDFAPSDRVAVSYQISCGTCPPCQRGRTAACRTERRGPGASMYGIGAAGGDWGGALADLLYVPFADAMLVRLPDGLSPAAAASAPDNVSDAWRAVGPALEVLPRAPVTILNGGRAGSIGLYAASIALALGAERVDYYDTAAHRIEAAAALGAHSQRVDAWPERFAPAPITVDASQHPEGLACSLRSTERGGFCTTTSVYFAPTIPFPAREMYFSALSFENRLVDARTVLPRVLDLMAAGRLAPERVTTETAGWREAQAAITAFTTKLVVVRDA